MSEQKVRNTFSRIYAELERFHKVVRKGGLLEKNIMDIGGDPTYLQDMREHIDFLMNSLEDAERGALGHIVESHASNKNVVTEGVLDGDDEDGFMARSQLYFLAKDAIQLHGLIDDRDNLEPWIQSKIAQSSEAIEAVRRYTEYNAAKAEVAMPDDIADDGDVEEGFKILPSIDRERYQERDGLEGPFRTTSGKVVYYDPAEGRYYDPDTDFYLSHEEWDELNEEFLPEFWPALAALASRAVPAVAAGLGRALGGLKSAVRTAPKRTPAASASRGGSRTLPISLNTGSDSSSGSDSDSDDGFASGYKKGMAITSSAKSKGKMIETEGKKPYVCVHAKKGSFECHADTTYGAAKQAAEHWKLKSTAGIDVHLADKEMAWSESTNEAEYDNEGFTDKEIKMAFGIINDPRWKSGNMTHIVDTIEKIAKGLSKHPSVAKAIQTTNEDTFMGINVRSKEDKIKDKKTQIELAKRNAPKSGLTQKDVPQLEKELEDLMNERKMSGAEKTKEKKLKTKYDDSGMKKSMKDQYGDEEGMKIYYATLRKKAMTKGAK